MIPLLTLWHEWSAALEWGSAAVGGWIANVARYKIRSQANKLSVGAQALQLNAILTERERELTEQLELMSCSHWSLLAQVEDLYVEAIAARLIVHELDVAAGRNMRDFKPLPPYPFPAPCKSRAAGATAAPTAEPRAENTHV